MDFLKSVAGKIVVGLVVLGVIAGGISWWTMDESTRSRIVTDTGRILGWAGVVLALPWATFFVIGWVGRMRRNDAGAALVLGYTAAEAVLLAWLFGWTMGSSVAWTFFGAGILLAGAYNLFACDWIAEKME
jgi:FtsH-binding integral membrane protein